MRKRQPGVRAGGPSAGKSAGQIQWWVYLLSCRGERTYAGVALDVAARFDLHVSGKGARFTRSFPPHGVLGAQSFATKSEALRAEAALKQLSPAAKRAWAKTRRWPSARTAVA